MPLRGSPVIGWHIRCVAEVRRQDAMEERREQFECSYCGQKFNFRKDAEAHEQNCPKKG
jgi:hypothetical protein